MDFTRFLRKKLLPILASRTVIFFFLMCLLTLFLYSVGTKQRFTDSTQLFLLELYIVLGIFLSVSSAYGMILVIWRFFREKKIRYLLRAAGYLLLVLFGAGTVLAVIFIVTLSGGSGH